MAETDRYCIISTGVDEQLFGYSWEEPFRERLDRDSRPANPPHLWLWKPLWWLVENRKTLHGFGKAQANGLMWGIKIDSLAGRPSQIWSDSVACHAHRS